MPRRLAASHRQVQLIVAVGLLSLLATITTRILAALEAVQQAQVTSSNGRPLDLFGSAVAVDGDTAIVGAPAQQFLYGDPNDGCLKGISAAGRAYIFVRSGTVWTEQANFEWVQNSQFGTAVAMSGDTIVVGAPGTSIVPQPPPGFPSTCYDFIQRGSVSVYVRDGASWPRQAVISLDGPLVLDNFGQSVAVSGNTLVIGGRHGTIAGGANATYVYARTGTTWTQQAVLPGSGLSVAVAGTTILAVRSAVETDVYVRIGGTWGLQAALFASGRASVSGDTALIGQDVWVRSGSTWTLQQVLPPGSGRIDGDTIVFGNPPNASLYVRSGTHWTLQQTLTSAISSFGYDAALSGGTVIVGANKEDVGANGSQGTAYIFADTGPVVTGAASDINATGARLNGTANPNGSSTIGRFEYGLTTAYGLTTPDQALGTGSAAVAIGGGTISGLMCNTLYHFRAIATSASGSTAGLDKNFTTSGCPPPAVVTGLATAIGLTGATLNGTANPNGSAASGHFEYGTTSSYGSSTPVQALGSGSVAVAIGGGALTGLPCGTAFHYRAAATNPDGTSTGSDMTFATSTCPSPSVTTGVAIGVSATGATLNGSANPNGAATTAYFEYGRTIGYGSATPAQSLGSGDGILAIGGGTVTGIACNTLYHFRAVAANVDWTVTGSDATFKTAPCRAGDLNGNGVSDVLWRNGSSGQNIGWLMNGLTVAASGFLPTIADADWEAKAVGDFDADGKADVIWRNRTTGQDIGWLMNGLTVASAAFLPTIADTNWEIVGAGDFDGDGKADVILRNRMNGQNIGWVMDGLSVANAAFLPTITDTNWEIVGIGDLNGDGKSDVLWRNQASGQDIGWLMNGLTVANSAFLPTIANVDWTIVGVGDVNGDGKADVLLRNRSTGQDIGWLMDGLTVVDSAFLPTIADTNWEMKAFGDFDGDGRSDVIWRNRLSGENIAWLMNGLVVVNSALLPTIADANWEIVGPR